MGSYAKETLTIGRKYIRMGEDTSIFAVFPNGLVMSDQLDTLHYFHVLCNGAEVDDIELSPTSDTRIVAMGKKALKIAQRYTIDGFNLTLKGNAIKSIQAFKGNETASKPFIKIDGDVSTDCHLVILSHEPETDVLINTQVIMNLTARITMSPGSPSEGESTRTISFYSETPEVYEIDGESGYSVGVEQWYQNGTVLNANAPDGILTAFTLGASNDQGVAMTVVPSAAELDASLTTWRQYLMDLRVNNVVAPVGDVTSVSPTVITFNDPVADEAKLFAMYITLKSTFPHAEGSTIWTPWEEVMS